MIRGSQLFKRTRKEVFDMKKSIWKLLLLAATLSSVQSQSKYCGNEKCPTFYKQVGRNCVYISTKTKLNWQEARETCHSIDGELLTLPDANSLREITLHLQVLGVFGNKFWIGANDKEREGSWRWIKDQSDVPMGTPFWGYKQGSPGHQPQGKDKQNCGILDDGFGGEMNDRECHAEFFFICEYVGK
ncbi:perlucin-like protein isoform X2 [Oratosquilla oratoria]|uniref:perlucin-like protein isoform X2 n=1 Tax=Oratosquilla oratoria TaxID=337810 RepID=UPI003F771D55